MPVKANIELLANELTQALRATLNQSLTKHLSLLLNRLYKLLRLLHHHRLIQSQLPPRRNPIQHQSKPQLLLRRNQLQRQSVRPTTVRLLKSWTLRFLLNQRFLQTSLTWQVLVQRCSNPCTRRLLHPSLSNKCSTWAKQRVYSPINSLH